MSDTTPGFDISQFNAVDLAKAKSDGNQFVLVRAGYGGGGKDSLFGSHWADAKKNGLVRLAYHFAYPGRSSGAQQAHDFLNNVGSLEAGDGLALDLESEVVYGRALVESDVAWSKDFLDTCLSLTGVKPLLYVNHATKGQFDFSSVRDGDYGLWQAAWQDSQPDAAPWDFNAVWQNSDSGNIGGIRVDTDQFQGALDALRKYGATGSVSPTPDPTPTPQPATPTAPAYYTVEPNDYLSKIAAKFNTTWQALASLNRIANPDLIYAGQILQVPGGVPDTYTVVEGDNLSAIAAKLGNGETWQHLVALNGIANPDKIYPGQVLKV